MLLPFQPEPMHPVFHPLKDRAARQNCRRLASLIGKSPRRQSTHLQIIHIDAAIPIANTVVQYHRDWQLRVLQKLQVRIGRIADDGRMAVCATGQCLAFLQVVVDIRIDDQPHRTCCFFDLGPQTIPEAEHHAGPEILCPEHGHHQLIGTAAAPQTPGGHIGLVAKPCRRRKNFFLRGRADLPLCRLAGPFCTMMLADMGANVIKIEVPKGGDDTRSYPPFRAKNLNGERESVYFANINRNKKGITLNLKAPEGKEIFKELVKKADIVVENYRPGVMDKLGLGYDVLKEINPRIIYAAVSGFGCYGPYHLRPGYDILAQAMGGMMSITGSKGGEPTRAGSALGDILGGLHVTIGILAAVNARTITGKGQRVDVSLMDSMIAATENTALKYIETGNIPAPMGNRYAAVSPYDSFTCKGGKVIIAAGNQKLYEKLCNEVLERPDMITDPRFVDMPGRLANQDAIAEVIEERIKDLTPNEAAELVLAHGIPAGPIMNIKEILDDPHVKEREMFVEMDHPTLGKVTVNGCAIKLMDTKPSVRTPAPQLGQNNRDIFEGVLGMTEEQFNTLHEKQVF